MVAVHPEPPTEDAPVDDVDVERCDVVVSDVVSDDEGFDEDVADEETISPLPPNLSTPDASPPGSKRTSLDLTVARVSIGHDVRVADENEQKLLDSLGRPVRFQSVFRSMSGMTTHYGESPTGMHPKLSIVDEDAYGATAWTSREMRNVAFYTFIHVMAFAALSYADPNSWWHLHRPLGDVIGAVNDGVVTNPTFAGHFWRKIGVQTAVFWTILPSMGLLVVTRGWNVGYTRKICHIVTYLTPLAFNLAWPTTEGEKYPPSVWVVSWSVWFQFCNFYLQIKPARRRSTVCMLAFRAYDRAQDRPNTLTWIVSQMIAGYLIILGLYAYCHEWRKDQLPAHAEYSVLIPMVVNVFGDALAEPVGIYFGRHPYRVRAMWYKGRCCAGEFKRTLEGSLVVYAFTLAAVAPCLKYGLFTRSQYAVNMALLPPLMTLTEAIAPHTWDNPFITLVGAAFILCTYEFVQ